MLPGNVDEWPTRRRRGRGVAAAVVAGLVLGIVVGIGVERFAFVSTGAPPILPLPLAEAAPPTVEPVSPAVEPAPARVETVSPTLEAVPSTVDASSTDVGDAPSVGDGRSGLNITGLLGNEPQSQNWAGYAATAGGYTTVSATWTIPEVALSFAPGTDATWVGIGGVRSRDLIQAGTDRTLPDGTVGKPHQEAWIELLPQPSVTVPLALRSGDSIQVSISQQGPESWLIAFTNNTSGESYQVTEHYASSLSSVEWIEEAPSVGRGRQLPLDDFGTLSFSQASTIHDDEPVTIAQSGAHPITMITPSGLHLVEPSGLGADGTSFSVARTTVPSPALRRRS